MTKKSHIINIAFVTILISILVFALKFYAYWRTQSTALYSDALESVVNIFASLMSWVAIYIGTKPADRNHAYGHYKAEYISAAIEGGMIFIVALLILFHVATQFYHYFIAGQLQIFSNIPLGLGINFVSLLINAAWGMIVLQAARQQRSPALEADAWHLFSDVITSLGVIFGVFIAFYFQWPLLDPLIALCVACFILWQGGSLVKSAVNGLMDHSISLKEIKKIEEIIVQNASGAIEFHDLRTRLAGRAIFIEFHLVVPELMTVGKAHDICDRIETALEKQIENVNIVIHIEPENHAYHSEHAVSVQI